MEGPYGSEWPSEEKIKRREMVAPEARYILICQYADSDIAKCLIKQDSGVECANATCHGGRLLGFVHYRFVVEEDVPVLYVYELQLESSAQGKGLGKFLMQLIELIARKSQMGAMMLTVQKSNTDAMAFYNNLGYVISSTSPSRVDPLIGFRRSYEILCKTFESEAKCKLEASFTRAKKWVQELQAQGNPTTVVALAGNKADLLESRQVQVEEAKTYAQENGLFFMETSAKTATNVNDIFYEIAKRLLQGQAAQNPQAGMVLSQRPNERVVSASSCCS